MIGFYAPRSHRVVEQHDCLLQPEIFRTVVDIVGRWAKHTGLPIYDETTGKGILRHLYIREAEATGEIQVCLVCTSGKLPDTHALIDSLRREVPGLVSVMVNLNREDTNVVLGGKGFVLWGREWITDELCGLRFRLSPQSFYQVNRRQAEILYGIAGDFVSPGRRTRCSTSTAGPGRSGFPWQKERDRSSAWRPWPRRWRMRSECGGKRYRKRAFPLCRRGRGRRAAFKRRDPARRRDP